MKRFSLTEAVSTYDFLVSVDRRNNLTSDLRSKTVNQLSTDPKHLKLK